MEWWTATTKSPLGHVGLVVHVFEWDGHAILRWICVYDIQIIAKIKSNLFLEKNWSSDKQ